jgi:hypothetical protein
VKSTHKSWIDDKRMIVLIQLSFTKHPELPDVPLAMDFAKTDEQRQILKMAPPNVPADRVAALRDAFSATMADKDFRAEADKVDLEINPVSGADVEKLVKDVYATPPEVIAKAKAARRGSRRDTGISAHSRESGNPERLRNTNRLTCGLNLQHAAHHRHAAAADCHTDDFAAAFVGASLE